MSEERINLPARVSPENDTGRGQDFFQDAKNTNRLISGVEPESLGDELAYEDMGSMVFDKSEKLTDEQVSKKKKKVEEDEYEEEDSSEDDNSETEEDEELEEDEESDSTEDEDEESDAEKSDSEDEGEATPTKGYSLVVIDGEEVRIPDSTKLTLKIDGEKQTLTFGKLKQLKSGEVSYNRKFTALGEKEKSLNKREKVVEQELQDNASFTNRAKLILTDLREHVKNDRFEDILTELYAHFGKDPIQFWNHYDEKNAKYYGQFNALPEAARALKQQERAVILREMAIDRQTKQQAANEKTQNYENFKVNLLKQTPGDFTQNDVKDAWGELTEMASKGEIDEQTRAQLAASTPEAKYRFALAFAVEKKIDSKIEAAVEKVAPKFKAKLDKIARILRDERKVEKLLSMSEKDMEHAIRLLTGSRIPDKKKGNKGYSTTNSLRDKASPRHKAERPQRNAASESHITPGKDIWGMSGLSSATMLRGSKS